MEKARLFIAVDLPAGIREKICRVCAGIGGVRWTKREQLHLTLNFLGDIDCGIIAARGKPGGVEFHPV